METGMAMRDLVAIGTSAGGVDALIRLAKALPRAFPASVLLTLHLPEQFKSSLDEILTAAGPLGASFARDGETLRKAHIHIAPPGRHLIVEGETLALGTGPRENNARPAIDPMMRSAALCCGPRSIGVVLTGTLGDGASGLWTIRRCGGVSIVQDPHDATFPQMPLNALNEAAPDHVVALAELPGLLESLVHEPAGPSMPVPAQLRYEIEVARGGRSDMTEMDKIGRRSTLTCPDCDGVMWEIEEGDLVRYRCHVGHAYTAEVMSIALDASVRHALGSALRALEERVALMERMEGQARERGSMRLAATWTERAQEFDREAEVIRKAIRRVDDIAEKARADKAA
jgi:two-component system chemotaxis response regulator CheB